MLEYSWSLSDFVPLPLTQWLYCYGLPHPPRNPLQRRPMTQLPHRLRCCSRMSLPPANTQAQRMVVYPRCRQLQRLFYVCKCCSVNGSFLSVDLPDRVHHVGCSTLIASG